MNSSICIPTEYSHKLQKYVLDEQEDYQSLSYATLLNKYKTLYWLVEQQIMASYNSGFLTPEMTKTWQRFKEALYVLGNSKRSCTKS